MGEQLNEWAKTHRALPERWMIETWKKVYEDYSTFRRDATLWTWLYRIATNAAFDVVRKRGRGAFEDDTTSNAQGVEDPDPCLRVDVARALGELPEEFRLPVVMHDMGAIPYDEIAGIMKISIGTVKSRISRGRKRLAELMEPRTPSASSKETR